MFYTKRKILACQTIACPFLPSMEGSSFSMERHSIGLSSSLLTVLFAGLVRRRAMVMSMFM
jgi:hypothetical protein